MPRLCGRHFFVRARHRSVTRHNKTFPRQSTDSGAVNNLIEMSKATRTSVTADKAKRPYSIFLAALCCA